MEGRLPAVRALSVTNVALAALAVGVIVVVGPVELVDRAVRVGGWQGSIMTASTYLTLAVVLVAAGLSATLSTRPNPLLAIGGFYLSALALARILSVGWRSETWLLWVTGALFIGMNLAALFFVQRFPRTLVFDAARPRAHRVSGGSWTGSLTHSCSRGASSYGSWFLGALPSCFSA